MNNYIKLITIVFLCAALAEFAMDNYHKGTPFFFAFSFAIFSGLGYLILALDN